MYKHLAMKMVEPRISKHRTKSGIVCHQWVSFQLSWIFEGCCSLAVCWKIETTYRYERGWTVGAVLGKSSGKKAQPGVRDKSVSKQVIVYGVWASPKWNLLGILCWCLNIFMFQYFIDYCISLHGIICTNARNKLFAHVLTNVHSQDKTLWHQLEKETTKQPVQDLSIERNRHHSWSEEPGGQWGETPGSHGCIRLRESPWVHDPVAQLPSCPVAQPDIENIGKPSANVIEKELTDCVSCTNGNQKKIHMTLSLQLWIWHEGTSILETVQKLSQLNESPRIHET